MNHGRTVFSQVMEYVSHNEFNRCVERYDGNKSVRRLTCWDQFLVMAFAQLTNWSFAKYKKGSQAK